MGANSSRHHRNPSRNPSSQQPQVHMGNQPYPVPHPGGRGFVPMPAYPTGLNQYGHRMPPTHGQGHGGTASHAAANNELHQTKTIRNRVNLKKPTLKLTPKKNDPEKLIPNFVFDASAPCSVTVFYMAQEDASKKSKLTTIMQEPGPRALYPTGVRVFVVGGSDRMCFQLGQTFPPEGKEADYALDMNLYLEEDLTSVNGDVTFPLIIRLETVTDTSSESHSLEELQPGSPTPTWIQSQTTYAYLIKTGNAWEVRTVKQKIWVDGISYELQEIYGIQGFYQNEKKADKVDTFTEDIDGRECVICLAALRDTTVLPCRHMCMCASCARELQRQQVSTCPICRDEIESLLHIKRPEKKSIDKTSEKKESKKESQEQS